MGSGTLREQANPRLAQVFGSSFMLARAYEPTARGMPNRRHCRRALSNCGCAGQLCLAAFCVMSSALAGYWALLRWRAKRQQRERLDSGSVLLSAVELS